MLMKSRNPQAEAPIDAAVDLRGSLRLRKCAAAPGRPRAPPMGRRYYRDSYSRVRRDRGRRPAMAGHACRENYAKHAVYLDILVT